jgi:CRP-like cAMP-binding protein
VPGGDGTPSDNLLADVDPAFAEAVLEDSSTRDFSRDDVIYEVGDPADTLLVVLDGQVAMTFEPPGVAAVTLAVLGRSAVFGTGAFMKGDPTRRSRSVGLTAGSLLVLPVATVLEQAERHPSAAIAIISGLAAQITEFSDRLAEALQLPAAERVRGRLYALAVSTPDDHVPISQESLAALAGTSRATANGMLRDLQRAGTVNLGRGRIEVPDPAALLDDRR